MRTWLPMLIAAVGLVACVTAGPTTTVPLALVRNCPIVSADIDGHKVRLMLDLGYDTSLGLTHATLEQLGITPSGLAYTLTNVKGHIMGSPTFEVPRLRIGGAIFTHVTGRVDVHDPSSPPARFGQQGSIGPSLFSGYRIVLNYRGGTMTLIPPGSQHSERTRCIRAAVGFPKGVARVQTDFGSLALVWDTGSPVSFIRRARIDHMRAKVVNHAVRTQLFRLNNVDFGPLELVPLDFSEPPGVDGFIGGNFFDQHVVCFDFPPRSWVPPPDRLMKSLGPPSPAD